MLSRAPAIARPDPCHGETRGRRPVAQRWSRPCSRRLYASRSEPQERLARRYRPRASSLQGLTLRCGNTNGPVNTVVTAAVKRVRVACDEPHATESGVPVVPYLPGGTLGQCPGPTFSAGRGEHCRVEIGDGFNKFRLGHFVHYLGGRGGRDRPRNRADIAAQIEVRERRRLVGDQVPR